MTFSLPSRSHVKIDEIQTFLSAAVCLRGINFFIVILHSIFCQNGSQEDIVPIDEKYVRLQLTLQTP